MNLLRTGFRASAVLGATAVAALATAPAFAADPIAQATAQSLTLTIANNSVVSQTVTATNDGTSQTKNDASTVPTIAGILPGNSALGAGVAPQDAGANADGTSYACAGIAGTGGGIVHTGNTSCNINGAPITLNLGSLTLGSVAIDPTSALGSALDQAGLGSVLNTITAALQNNVINSITSALKSTPLNISLGGTLSAIEATCTATPTAATGTAHLVDTQGGSANTPITATIAGQTVTIADLPANPPPNTHVLTGLNTVTQTLVDAIKTELAKALGGTLNQLPLGTALQTVQDDLINTLVQQLQPALQPLQQNVLDITLNKQASSDGGKKIDVTALDLQVLPAASAFTGGSSLIAGQLGHVTCGPNARAATPSSPKASANPAGSGTGNGPSGDSGGSADGNTPLAVDAGLAGDDAGDGRTALYAGLGGLALAGAAGTLAYRRFASK